MTGLVLIVGCYVIVQLVRILAPPKNGAESPYVTLLAGVALVVTILALLGVITGRWASMGALP